MLPVPWGSCRVYRALLSNPQSPVDTPRPRPPPTSHLQAPSNSAPAGCLLRIFLALVAERRSGICPHPREDEESLLWQQEPEAPRGQEEGKHSQPAKRSLPEASPSPAPHSARNTKGSPGKKTSQGCRGLALSPGCVPASTVTFVPGYGTARSENFKGCRGQSHKDMHKVR